jgi:uncharacterized protein (TIGR00369 family)
VTTSEQKPVPEGWAPLRRSSPFVQLVGPLHGKEAAGGLAIGLRVEQKHLNTQGVAHGGMLVALADTALGIVLSLSEEPPRPMVTVSLSVDFTSAARLGAGVEARVEIEKSGKRLAFASCHVTVEGRLALRASGVFAFVAAPRGKEGFEG